ncbi:Zinc finger protein [Histomonas meleagridis]|uniref:Zinc finger protein DZIP1L n=1 Tax=Histomonas meleagridis TaxID=135588 RepID=UPI00355AA65A|nr:Zinc finger protein [Histomonas meleagridis]KAH0805489.1 Zinc finger protein DZIP1L [Histomonas meleagridis]
MIRSGFVPQITTPPIYLGQPQNISLDRPNGMQAVSQFPPTIPTFQSSMQIPQGFIPMTQPAYIQQQHPPPQQQQTTNAPLAPPPTSETYSWAPRTEPMRWPMAESIDIETIVKRGDLNSVLFYMSHFTYANITKEDLSHFGSKGALNAFLIMQLANDYLLAQKKKSESEMKKQVIPPEIVEQYNQNLDLASKEIEKRDNQIATLRKQVSQMHEERKKVKILIKKYEEKFKKLKSQTKTTTKPRKHIRTFSDTEPGAIHDETEYRELKRMKLESSSPVETTEQSFTMTNSETGEVVSSEFNDTSTNYEISGLDIPDEYSYITVTESDEVEEEEEEIENESTDELEPGEIGDEESFDDNY